MRVILGFVIFCLGLGAGLALIAQQPVTVDSGIGGMAVVVFGSIAAYMVGAGGLRRAR